MGCKLTEEKELWGYHERECLDMYNVMYGPVGKLCYTAAEVCGDIVEHLEALESDEEDILVGQEREEVIKELELLKRVYSYLRGFR